MGWREKNRPAAPEYWWWRGCKGKGGGLYRHIRTTQERRAWDPEFGRAKRSMRRLPDYYHELLRGSQRSWKRHRGTQFKQE